MKNRINSQYSTIIQFFDPSFNSQQSTVNNNSGATGIDIKSTGLDGGIARSRDRLQPSTTRPKRTQQSPLPTQKRATKLFNNYQKKGHSMAVSLPVSCRDTAWLCP
ncbi:MULTISPECIES: hypothetical protein [unclassified Microcoleus]|uniref:hypothetical protein n=1 Tax=unclassified Microcoleus TaxID=2642155 RepID=UPI002FD77E42